MARKRWHAAVLIATGVILGAITVAPGFAEAPSASKRFVNRKVRRVTQQVQAIQGRLGSFQEKCRPGSNLAFARTPANFTSSSYVDVPGYNCAGGGVQARRSTGGIYFFRFPGLPLQDDSPTFIAVATVLSAQGRVASVFMNTDVTQPVVEVTSLNTISNNLEDNPVSVLVLQT